MGRLMRGRDSRYGGGRWLGWYGRTEVKYEVVAG